MTDYVVPSGVRIADADRVRLGAHLAAGTTVMHEGFCNFNAGTLGTSMVEGRISAGVIVGDGSDIGGGASIMGTLSGGGKEQITIGERCLLGAEAGIGISLGDECVVEAGLYVTAGTLVKMPDGEVVKARQLSGAQRTAVPPQQPDRRGRGDPPLRRLGRPQRRSASQRLNDRGRRTKMADMTDNEKLVHEFFATLSTGDLEALRPLLHPDGSWEVMSTAVPGAGLTSGRDAVIDEFLGTGSRHVRPRRPEGRSVKRTFASGDLVCAETEGIGELRNGNHYHNRYAWVIEISDGQVCHLREYMDTAYIMSVI